MDMRRYETLVVDVTYRCNSPCAYCRWGNSRTQGRVDLGLDEVLLSRESLLAVGTRRVVISGGEPTLFHALPEVLSHYAALVAERVVITNGLLLDDARRERLLSAGATGFTVSLDTLDAASYRVTRGWPPHTLVQVLDNLAAAAEARRTRPFELGINAVVSRATASWSHVAGLFGLACLLGLDFVKFAPVFDDGFVSANAPWLTLDATVAADLLDVADRVVPEATAFATNPPGFWHDLARMCAGAELDGSACALGRIVALVVRGTVTRCFWVSEATIGVATQAISNDMARRSLTVLHEAKPRCRVASHCFCLQPLDHVWQA